MEYGMTNESQSQSTKTKNRQSKQLYVIEWIMVMPVQWLKKLAFRFTHTRTQKETIVF